MTHDSRLKTPKTILLLDNYDSFTYNLVHLVEKLTDLPLVVKRNDEINLDEVADFGRIILSPGPGLPADAGIMLELIKKYKETIPILGVCLGHQAIGEAFGAKLKNLGQVLHGVAVPVEHFGHEPLFTGIPNSFLTGRYHSWVVDENGFPDALQIIAKGQDGSIQALRHKNLNIWGVQFHPESIMTEYGEQLVKNWLGQ
ncbi:MAG: aminodeoxychorismate/anthranilate synthase component II [Bacteroidetes bacterium]|nr:aminodeoxychorismate/anthranilate synthase component II [Bacteroidota bacterium]